MKMVFTKLPVPELYKSDICDLTHCSTYVAMFNIAVYNMAERDFTFRLQIVFMDIFQLTDHKVIFPLCNGDAAFFFEVVTTCSYIV
jgi:hypothetical protein